MEEAINLCLIMAYVALVKRLENEGSAYIHIHDSVVSVDCSCVIIILLDLINVLCS